MKNCLQAGHTYVPTDILSPRSSSPIRIYDLGLTLLQLLASTLKGLIRVAMKREVKAEEACDDLENPAHPIRQISGRP